MVSGRFAAVARQLILAGIIFVGVGIFIVNEENKIYEEAKESFLHLRKLEKKHRILLEKGAEVSHELNKTNQVLKTHLNHIEVIEQFTKKKNLILRGFEETEGEDLESKLLEFFEKNLNTILGASAIEFAERIEGGDPRPILIRFTRLKAKSKVFYKRKSLPKAFSMEEDLTQSQRGNRKKLDAFAKEASKNGKSVKWNGGKLIIDGKEIDSKSILRL